MMAIDFEAEVTNLVATVLGVSKQIVRSDLAIGDVPEWDSVANVQILQALEERFEIEISVMDSLDAEDVSDFINLARSYVDQIAT